MDANLPKQKDTCEERVDAIRLKEMLDPKQLTEQELMCLQIESSINNCHVCNYRKE